MLASVQVKTVDEARKGMQLFSAEQLQELALVALALKDTAKDPEGLEKVLGVNTERVRAALITICTLSLAFTQDERARRKGQIVEAGPVLDLDRLMSLGGTQN
jgi:hypothetical protein